MERFSTPLIESTKEYVGGFIGDHFTEKICYHNIDHTLGVVEACQLISDQTDISSVNLEQVIIAAWFHDAGYYLGCKDHEKESVQIAKNFLQKKNLNSAYIKNVEDCILSTKIPQFPKSLAEQILCDADLYHLSSDLFFTRSALLLREINIENQVFTPLEWMFATRDFMELHRFHTSYGKKVLQPKLKENLAKLRLKIAEMSK